MPDYSKGKIYTIKHKTDPTLVYVGSTTQLLNERFNGHKTDKKRRYKSLLYEQVQDWNDWYIELYENYPCNSIQELRIKEGEIIKEIGTLNKCIAGRTQKERNYRDYHNNIEKEKHRRKEYNKEKIVCECGCTFSRGHLRRHNKSQKHLDYLSISLSLCRIERAPSI